MREDFDNNDQQAMPPKLGTQFLRWYCQKDYLDEIEGDLLELYQRRVKKYGSRTASFLYLLNVLTFMRGYTLFSKKNNPITNNPTMMIGNYFKVFRRSYLRNKLISSLTVSGLVIGIGTFLILGLYVYDELSFDRFHKQKDFIYKYYEDSSYSRLGETRSPSMSVAMADLIEESIPEIDKVVKFLIRESSTNKIVEGNNKIFNVLGVTSADSTFFDVFDFELIYGNRKKVLNKPHDIVISRDLALKYFERLDVIGRKLTIGKEGEYLVSGIMENLPHNTHFKFDYITLFQLPTGRSPSRQTCDVFIVLKNKNAKKVVDEKLNKMLQNFKRNEKRGFKSTVAIGLLSLEDIHLKSGYTHGSTGEPTEGDIRYVWLFSAIAFLVLVVSFINYVNFSTAAYVKRSFEIGIRKVVGAGRKELIFQLYLETFFTIFVTAILAVAIVYFMLPYYNNFMGSKLSFSGLPWQFVPAFLLMLFVFTLLAGSYPALFLSKYNPATALKGKMPQLEKNNIRKYMVVFQFLICQLLIISTVVIQKQLYYLQNKNLGFNKEQMMVIPISRKYTTKQEYLKNRILSTLGVENVSLSFAVPGKISSIMVSNSKGFENPINDSLNFIIDGFSVDYGYLDNYQFKLSEGRFFSPEFTSDSTYAIIINKTLQKKLGWKKPIGKWYGRKNKKYVVGVVEDFHNKTLKQGYEPAMFEVLNTPEKANNISVRLSTTDIRKTVDQIESIWKNEVSDYPFEYYFLDEFYDNMYKKELRLGQIMNFFAVLSVTIGLIGLVGLTLFVTQRRTREIGIRKSFGASVSDIIGLVSKDFIVLVAIGIFIATPLAWYMTEEWLKNFTFKTSPGILIMFLCGVFTIVIAILAIGLQTFSAARAKPVDALRVD